MLPIATYCTYKQDGRTCMYWREYRSEFLCDHKDCPIAMDHLWRGTSLGTCHGFLLRLKYRSEQSDSN